MKKKYEIQGHGAVFLDDSNYLVSGGEAQIFTKDSTAYKIYFDPSKTIPSQKIAELSQIKDHYVIVPESIVYHNNVPVGYTCQYKKNMNPLCKLFTKSFNTKNNITNDMITNLIEKMQQTVENIHKAKCLVVDLNEMNELVSPYFKSVYFIDVDSYQTPSYHATAIMESIRDRKIQNNHWTENSDWFSFGILSFQMWIGIHPYKGKHPDYKPNEWLKRMDNGVSVFDKKCTLPANCNELSTIPYSHYMWLNSIFADNERKSPPVMKIAWPVHIVDKKDIGKRTIISNAAFDIVEIATVNENIIDICDILGTKYILTFDNLYKNNKVVSQSRYLNGTIKSGIIASKHASPIIYGMDNDDNISFYSESGNVIGVIKGKDVMSCNNCVYSLHDGSVVENRFDQIGPKVFHTANKVASVMPLSTSFYHGVIFEDIVGRSNLLMPYSQGQITRVKVEELNGYRIIDAKRDRNTVVVIGLKNKQYRRFIIMFDTKFENYSIRHDDSLSYDSVNIIQMANGTAIMTKNGTMETFRGNNINVVNNAPITSDNKLYEFNNVVVFIDGKTLYSIKMK